MARMAYLEAKATGALFAPDDVRGSIVAEEGGTQFMVNLSIGQPPVQQLTTMDTGSGLFWIQCLPCTKCLEQSSPLFDPSKSSTYANLSCTKCFNQSLQSSIPSDHRRTPICLATIDCQRSFGKCDRYKECTYNYSYARGSTIGNLASDILVSGCDHINVNSTRDWQESVTLGLCYALYSSLVVQLVSKFSCCIGDINNPKCPHNQLILEKGSTMEGDSMTLETFQGLYYVNLQSIIVGEKMLDIDPRAFKRSPSGEDTGSVRTRLQTDGYRGLRRVKYGHNPAMPCYVETVEREVSDFPVVALHFDGRAKLNMDAGLLLHGRGC
ncbi:hypothetical protein BT93_C0083 [Corymbia citriodora subsp. variegata]|nr:hypothetical protein BT93_C0083 [Corymbia citriodora subsp. variegata]